MPATGNKVFAPAIFFIAAREALEASLVIGILSGMLENLVLHTNSAEDIAAHDALSQEEKVEVEQKKRALVRKLRKIVSFPFRPFSLSLSLLFFPDLGCYSEVLTFDVDVHHHRYCWELQRAC